MSVQPLRVLDINFDLLAEIENYASLQWTRRWHRAGEFELHLGAQAQGVEHLQKGNLVLVRDMAAIILHREIRLLQDGTEHVVVKGAGLASIVGRRITIPPVGYAYDRRTATVETLMKHYVRNNCTEPAVAARVIDQLVIAADQGRGQSMTYQSRLKQLDEELQKLSTASGLGWDVWLDQQAKQMVFDVLEGRDLTADQVLLPPVIFSVDFDAVRSQVHTDSDIGYRNQAYVGGQGEGVDREIVEVGEGKVGLNRFETFVDARDMADGADLPARGQLKLQEMQQLTSFETEIMPQGPFVYREDWDLGDIVTVQNKRWSVTIDVRVSEVREIYEPGGLRLDVTFGTPLPTLVDKFKQASDAPLIEKGLYEDGDPGAPGADGIGLQYVWQGTELGIKREDESIYTYANLQGTQGLQGLQGEQGLPGSDATVTSANIEAALGYAPTSPTQLNTKVDKVAGKGLSTEDYTSLEKTKLASVETGANKYSHPANHLPSVIAQDASNRFVSDAEKTAWNAKETPAGAQGKVDTHADNVANPHSVTKSQVGLGNVSNTADADKPISTAVQTALDGKVNNAQVLTNVPVGAKFTDTTTTINGKTGEIAKADIVALGIPAQDTVYSHPSSHPASMITGLPTSLPADGGNADTVGGFTVGVNVPAGAKFTDTVYTHPTNHPPSIITQDTSNRFVTDAEKTAWNAKETPSGAQSKVDVHASNTANPHGITKAQVSLGSVQNYGLATQLEAEAGAISTKYMTPLRTKQAIDKFKPTKLSELENDIGAGAGLNIVVSATEPAGLKTGDWWYKEV